jgi:RNA polymerase sigma-70 factor, ECF subfamily
LNLEIDNEILSKLSKSSLQNEGFQLLIKHYQKPLYYHLRNILYDHEDTNDVLQNTYIKIFKNIQNFKGESKLYSWLYRIASNESFTFLEQKRKKQMLSNEDLQQKSIENLQTDVYFNGYEITQKLHNAIAVLPQKQQMVFKLRYFEELKYEQISEILDTSIGALKANYHHAVKKIEEYLEKN